MGNENSSVDSDSDDAITLRNDLAETRAQMGDTLDALHGRLNPAVLKAQALDSFHEVKATVASELKQQFNEAKDAVRAEMAEAKSSITAELADARDALKAELTSELKEAKAKMGDELVEAKAAVREATIGRVEHMVHDAQDKISETGTSMMSKMRANPLPMALIGAGLAWMYFGGRKSSRSKQLPESTGMMDALDSVGTKATDATRSVGHAMEGAAQQVTTFASKSGSAFMSSAQDATNAVGKVAHQAADKTVALAKTTKETAVGLGQRTATSFRSNPMAFGAVFLAAGTAIGLAIPSSRKEDALMGEVRDQLVGRAEDMAHDALHTVGDAAKQFTDSSLKKINDGDGAKKSPMGAPSV